MSLVPVKLDGLALDMTTNTPVVILSPEDDERVLPIWIGHAEAWAIAMELSGVKSDRPMTHDLLRKTIELLDAEVDRIEITGLQEQTFFAVVHLNYRGETRRLDARPSDSIALALKTKCPMFVDDALFDAKPQGSEERPSMPTDRESLRERLKKINPEDFGKYSL
jgi:hypothetical protein